MPLSIYSVSKNNIIVYHDSHQDYRDKLDNNLWSSKCVIMTGLANGSIVLKLVDVRCEHQKATDVSFEDLSAFFWVLQRREGQVGDGDRCRRCQRDQQHQDAPGLLQRQLQVMGLLFTQSG